MIMMSNSFSIQMTGGSGSFSLALSRERRRVREYMYVCLFPRIHNDKIDSLYIKPLQLT
jgi:hypothetical protein